VHAALLVDFFPRRIEILRVNFLLCLIGFIICGWWRVVYGGGGKLVGGKEEEFVRGG
jgi:hypothetical protein